MLTFRVKLLEMLEGKKVTTIRLETPARKRYWDIHSDPTNTERHHPIMSARYSQKYFDRLILEEKENIGKLWWQNPRNRSPYCRKIGEVPLKYIERKPGYFLTTEDAKKDGFKSHGELVTALGQRNQISEYGVHAATWYIYSWDEMPVAFEEDMSIENHRTNRCPKLFHCPICKALENQEAKQ